MESFEEVSHGVMGVQRREKGERWVNLVRLSDPWRDCPRRDDINGRS